MPEARLSLSADPGGNHGVWAPSTAGFSMLCPSGTAPSHLKVLLGSPRGTEGVQGFGSKAVGDPGCLQCPRPCRSRPRSDQIPKQETGQYSVPVGRDTSLPREAPRHQQRLSPSLVRSIRSGDRGPPFPHVPRQLSGPFPPPVSSSVHSLATLHPSPFRESTQMQQRERAEVAQANSIF